MARSWQYPISQRVAMQIAMGLILGGTVALAGWVTHERRKSFLAENASENQRLSFPMPDGWKLVRRLNGGLVMAGPAPSGGERQLIITMPDARGARSPQEFLLRSGLLKGAFVGNDDEHSPDQAPVPADGGRVPMGTIQVAGKPGIVVWLQRADDSSKSQLMTLHDEFIACAIAGPNQAIVMRLDFPNGDDPRANLAILREVAVGMTLGDK